MNLSCNESKYDTNIPTTSLEKEKTNAAVRGANFDKSFSFGAIIVSFISLLPITARLCPHILPKGKLTPTPATSTRNIYKAIAEHKAVFNILWFTAGYRAAWHGSYSSSPSQSISSLWMSNELTHSPDLRRNSAWLLKFWEGNWGTDTERLIKSSFFYCLMPPNL